MLLRLSSLFSSQLFFVSRLCSRLLVYPFFTLSPIFSVFLSFFLHSHTLFSSLSHILFSSLSHTYSSSLSLTHQADEVYAANLDRFTQELFMLRSSKDATNTAITLAARQVRHIFVIQHLMLFVVLLSSLVLSLYLSPFQFFC